MGVRRAQPVHAPDAIYPLSPWLRSPAIRASAIAAIPAASIPATSIPATASITHVGRRHRGNDRRRPASMTARSLGSVGDRRKRDSTGGQHQRYRTTIKIRFFTRMTPFGGEVWRRSRCAPDIDCRQPVNAGSPSEEPALRRIARRSHFADADFERS